MKEKAVGKSVKLEITERFSEIRRLLGLATLYVAVFFISGCENRIVIDEVQNVISINDLNIQLKTDIDNDFEIQQILDTENSNTYYLKIDVANKFSIRGITDIEAKKKYLLSVTLKNSSANPLVMYSFWKGIKTSVRNYTLAGENGNPPISKTQNITNDWVTFNTYFEAQEGEESFMISIFCEKGIFYIKEIKIEEIKE